MPESERLSAPRPLADADGGGAVGQWVVASSTATVVQAGRDATVTVEQHFHPRPAPVVPQQLPATPGTFTGRVGELTELDRALRPSTVSSAPGTGAAPTGGATLVISAIGGAGGIGKTWLALSWANRHLDRFPDGQLFVDLHGFSPTDRPKSAADALQGFLEALGVDPDRIPADVDARAAMYRSRAANKRMLVLLDNAATSEQVVPLLPGGASCTVLVTSRNRLGGLVARHGAHPLPLGVLTDAEAHAVLQASLGPHRVGEAGQAITELIALCGGFPLALGLIAARARTQPHLPVDEVVAELRELGLDALDHADDPTAGLPAVLSWSLRLLTEEQRTVFALLGIAPGPDTGLPAAACLTGLPSARTRIVLRDLADASLVDRAPGGRHTMHDLVRAYATTHARALPRPVREAALTRVNDFYLHTAHDADRLLDPRVEQTVLGPPVPGVRAQPLSDRPTALAWLQAEHTNLLAAQQSAAALGRHRAVSHLAQVLRTFHYQRGDFSSDLTAWRAALTAAADLPDPVSTVRAHRGVGFACAGLGRHEEALGHLHRALALAEEDNDLAQQALTHHELATSWELGGDNRMALAHARRALGLYRAADLPGREAVALNSVGWYAAGVGEYDTARDHCQAALILHRRHHDPVGEAHTLDSLGFIAHHTGHHEQALDRYRQALTLYQELGNTFYAAGVLDHFGHAHAALGQREQVRVAWQEALRLYREQGRAADVHRVQRQLDDLDPTPEVSGTTH
ncbi:ATP-binding protein [Actinosynnema sp. CA-299493]